MTRRWVPVLVLAAVIPMLLSAQHTAAAPVAASRAACLPVFCDAHHTPKATETPIVVTTPSPSDFIIAPPTGGPTLPPTATPRPVAVPTPTPASVLPGGDAPQVAAPIPSGVSLTSTLPTGGAPDATKNPLGVVVFWAFVVLFSVTVASLVLFFKLK